MSTVRQAGTDPASRYGSPRELFEDDTLDHERKRALLRQWEYDLRSMQVAADENMPNMASHPGGESADFLTEVRECLRDLGDVADDESAAPNKQGAGSVDKRELP